jgi:hypothetical protein
LLAGTAPISIGPISAKPEPIKGNVSHTRSAEVFNRDEVIGACLDQLFLGRHDVVTNDQPHQIGAGKARCGAAAGHPAIAQYRNVIGDGENFVQVVRNEQHAKPGRLHPAHDLEQLSHVGVRKIGGRLIQHQQATMLSGPAQQRPGFIDGADDRQHRSLPG